MNHYRTQGERPDYSEKPGKLPDFLDRHGLKPMWVIYTLFIMFIAYRH